MTWLVSSGVRRCWINKRTENGLRIEVSRNLCCSCLRIVDERRSLFRKVVSACRNTVHENFKLGYKILDAYVHSVLVIVVQLSKK